MILTLVLQQSKTILNQQLLNQVKRKLVTMPGPLSKTVNVDLDNERKKCSFNVEELAKWWYGGAKQLEEKRKIENFLFTDPELNNFTPTSYLSHKERFEEGNRKALLLLKKIKSFQPQADGNYEKRLNDLRKFFTHPTGILKEGNAMILHYLVFLPSFLSLATPEQQDEWFERAWNLNLIGAFAQTELGHGTFLRGLETKATYDVDTKEFVLESPTLSSSKWWPGGLGQICNHAIVVAQLYIKEKCYGIHHFMVQTRDEKSWKPMPGIQVGEIGPTLGNTSLNNGFMVLNQIRIPRKNMLMKNAQVLEDGTYIQSPSAILNYSTMLLLRSFLIKSMSNQLSMAVTIATRYSAIRRQSPIDPSKPEPQIIDHVSQQYKIFPCIARNVIYQLSSNYVLDLYNAINLEVTNGKFERLPELHAILCCLKGVCTSEIATSIETLRLACGGHGYMESSNFSTLYAHTTAACTYEGENTVLLLQAARFLLKSWNQNLKGGRLAPSTAYLRESMNNKQNQWDSSIPCIIKALELVAANKIRVASENVGERMKSGYSLEEANNLTSIELVQAAEAHCKIILVQSAYEMSKDMGTTVSSTLATVIHQFIELYAVDICLKSLGDLFRFTNITEKDVQNLQKRLENLLSQIRPNAIGFVDGFDLHDMTLSSTLGSYDGNVYERLFAEAQKSPLNQEVVNKSFELYLKPFLNSQL